MAHVAVIISGVLVPGGEVVGPRYIFLELVAVCRPRRALLDRGAGGGGGGGGGWMNDGAV